MWNGELAIADALLAPTFTAHLTADSTPPPAAVLNPLTAKAWIATIRAKYESLNYEVVLGPFRDGDMISAYWRISATVNGKTFFKVGVDFLKISGEKISDCWTMNNNALPL
ncbi:MAG: nuclear transport factor 2 family protein [Cardiobacteriaceae bacterium]|nr:nuclear transport factor 2 family protein [Cardiobacteriaceae bacterium]